MNQVVSASQGGVALVWDKDHNGFEVEKVKIRHPNMLTFELITGKQRFHVVGCYLPPSSLELLEPVIDALQDAPAGVKVSTMIWGDLNANLDAPISERDDVVTDVVDSKDLTDVSRHFAVRRSRRRGDTKGGRWTWTQEKEGRTLSSKVDYLLYRKADKRRFWRVGARWSEHLNTDHCAVVAIFRGGREGDLKRYRLKRRRFPIRLPRYGPHSELETAFQELADSVVVPPPREREHNSWISQRTWDLIDLRAGLWKGKRLSGRLRERLGRRIRASF